MALFTVAERLILHSFIAKEEQELKLQIALDEDESEMLELLGAIKTKLDKDSAKEYKEQLK